MVTSLYDNLHSPVSNVVQQLSKMMPLSDLYPGLSSLQFDDNLHAIYDQSGDQMDMPSLAFQPMDKPDENGAPGLLTTNSNHKEFFNNQIGDCSLDATPPITPLQADYSQASTFSTSGGVTCGFPASVGNGNGLCTDVHCNGESAPVQNSRDSSQLHCTESISPTSPLPHMDSSNSGGSLVFNPNTWKRGKPEYSCISFILLGYRIYLSITWYHLLTLAAWNCRTTNWPRTSHGQLFAHTHTHTHTQCVCSLYSVSL